MTIINTNSPTMPAAETPQPATMLEPEVVVDQLRAIRNQIADVAPLTTEQRKALRNTSNRVNNDILQESINMIGAADLVESAAGRPSAEVRALDAESNRWTAVESELRTMLNAIAGANWPSGAVLFSSSTATAPASLCTRIRAMSSLRPVPSDSNL